MKKVIVLALLLGAATVAQAQSVAQGPKLTDNVSVTLKGGVASPMQHFSFWPNVRGVAGLEIRKQVTPVLGLGIEGEWSVNTSSWNKNYAIWGEHSDNIIDHQLVGLFGTLNLMNLFSGYTGGPRAFELETHLGAGWWHAYKTAGPDQNSWYTKAGLNFNYTPDCLNKSLTFSFKPAVVWEMNGDVRKGVAMKNNASTSRFNINNAAVELLVGVTYHFGGNGSQNFNYGTIGYSEEELNARVNALRAESALTEAALAARLRAAEEELGSAKAQLTECEGRKVMPITSIVDRNSETLECNVFFRQGKSAVAADQMPNVERVATFLKNHPQSTVVIKGYASPEGSKEINERIARERANAVRDLLVNKYRVAASRITAEGQGVGDMFSEPDWNRVSVCLINNAK